MVSSTDGDTDAVEKLNMLSPLLFQALDPIRSGRFNSVDVVPVAEMLTGVLSTFSPSFTKLFAAMKRRDLCAQNALDTIQLAQLFPRKGWPLPWILGYAAFHCSLSAATASSLDANGGTFDATASREASEAPFETGVDELYCLSSAGFEELRVLAELHRELVKGDDFSNEVNLLKSAPLRIPTTWFYNAVPAAADVL